MLESGRHPLLSVRITKQQSWYRLALCHDYFEMYKLSNPLSKGEIEIEQSLFFLFIDQSTFIFMPCGTNSLFAMQSSLENK